MVGYFIEDIPYSTSGLSIDTTATPDLHATDDGFACMSLFPANKLHSTAVEKNGIIKIEADGKRIDIVRVRVNVRSADITSISEFVDGKQLDLFFDVETLATRGLTFMAETKEWLERWNARQ